MKPSTCDVVLLVDVETGDWNARGEFVLDRPSVDAQVLRVLRQQHRRVVVAPYEDARTTAARLAALGPGLVFNLTEWIDGDRTRDREIVALLERLRLPYTGATAAGLTLSRDKVRANRIVARLGCETPANFLVAPGRAAKNPGLAYPLFVKPANADGSDFISRQSLVHNERALGHHVRVLQARQAGLLLCERFVEGRDLFVALLGNQPQVMWPVELAARRHGRGEPTFSTRRVKQDVLYQRRWKLSYRRARLPAPLLLHIQTMSRKIFHALKLRDYARLDFRLTPDGRLVFIEANANPDLARDGLGTHGCFAGVPYADVIRRIVRTALARSG